MRVCVSVCVCVCVCVHVRVRMCVSAYMSVAMCMCCQGGTVGMGGWGVRWVGRGGWGSSTSIIWEESILIREYTLDIQTVCPYFFVQGLLQ